MLSRIKLLRPLQTSTRRGQATLVSYWKARAIGGLYWSRTWAPQIRKRWVAQLSKRTRRVAKRLPLALTLASLCTSSSRSPHHVKWCKWDVSERPWICFKQRFRLSQTLQKEAKISKLQEIRLQQVKKIVACSSRVVEVVTEFDGAEHTLIVIKN